VGRHQLFNQWLVVEFNDVGGTERAEAVIAVKAGRCPIATMLLASGTSVLFAILRYDENKDNDTANIACCVAWSIWIFPGSLAMTFYLTAELQWSFRCRQHRFVIIVLNAAIKMNFCWTVEIKRFLYHTQSNAIVLYRSTDGTSKSIVVTFAMYAFGAFASILLCPFHIIDVCYTLVQDK